MKDFFNEFKPIRNIFRKLNFWDVLYELSKIQKKTKKEIVPEVVEFIFLNSIVYSSYYKNLRTKNSLSEWTKLLSRTSELKNKVDSFWFDQKTWGTIHKMYLDQRKASHNNYLIHLYRYYFIFSNEELAKHIESKINLPYKDFFVCAMWLHSVFDKKSYAVEKTYFFQKNLDETIFNSNNISKTLNILSSDLFDFRIALKEEIRYDQDIFITHNYPHIRKPIFESEQKLFCLFPDHLLNQFTSGMYYIAEIYKREYKMSNPFGATFEKYVGVILDKNNAEKQIKIKKEILFNRGQNKTSDWIIVEEDVMVFIECKTKRLQIVSKRFEDIVESDISDISDAVAQTYKVYSFFLKGDISELKYDSKKFFIPIVLTLEEWFAGIPDFKEEVTKRVKDKLKIGKFDETLVDRFNFHIIPIASFETDIQIMTKTGFKNYFERIASGKLDKESFKYNLYFEKEINETFIKPYENQFEK